MTGSNLWTFTGTVSDPSSAGLQVQLAGVYGAVVTVGTDGTFSVTVQLAPGVTGNVTAQTTDWWGQQSNLATELI
jgi:hypothetical protein